MLSEKAFNARRVYTKARNIISKQLDYTTTLIASHSLKEIGTSSYNHLELQTLKRTVASWISKENLGKKPNSLDEAIHWIKKMKEKGSFQYESGETMVYEYPTCVIITCTDNLKILADSQVLIRDGTFEKAPPGFQQIYILHTIYKDFDVPVAFGFLADKMLSVIS